MIGFPPKLKISRLLTEPPSLNIMLENNKQSKVPNIAIPLTLPSACVGNWHRTLGSCHLLCRTSRNDQAMSEPYCIFTCQRFCQQTVTSRSFWWVMPPITCHVMSVLMAVGGAAADMYIFILLRILNPQCVVLCPQTYLAERLKLGLAEHHLRGPLTVSKMQTKNNCENLPVVNWTSWFEQCSRSFWHSTIPDWFVGIIIIAYYNPCVYIGVV